MIFETTMPSTGYAPVDNLAGALDDGEVSDRCSS